MKTLKDFIYESTLDSSNILEKVSDGNNTKAIEKFLKKNYRIIGEYTINNGVVDVDGSVFIKNGKINNLTNGMFVFGKVSSNFVCVNCSSLTSLEGAPEEVKGPFDCSMCDSLTSLEGAPKKVGMSFICAGCENLASLEGAPDEVGDSFCCSNCPNLKSLKGAPKKVNRTFFCDDCGVQFTEEQVAAVSKARFVQV